MTWPITLLVMTDGRRHCIEQTMASAEANLKGNLVRCVIHDDSGDEAYAQWLAGTYPTCTVVRTLGRSGFGGAIRSAWHYLRQSDDSAFIFHLEDDFTFNRPVDVDGMAHVLRNRHYLAQMALRRQPWNPNEFEAGGLIEAWPGQFTEVDAGIDTWLEHRVWFTTNPCLYRRDLILQTEWPEGAESEGRYAQGLLEHGYGNTRPDQVRFGYWGMFASGAAVTHIGHERAGTGY